LVLVYHPGKRANFVGNGIRALARHASRSFEKVTEDFNLTLLL
jgi:hypothetical protein